MTNRKRILIVDDEENNRKLMAAMLESLGHEWEVASDGIEALAKLELGIDLVLTDVMMPKIDGFEVCRRLKGDPKIAPIPVLLVTVLSDCSDRLKGIEAGANDFLSKPIDTQDVLLRVRNALQTKSLFDRLEESYHRLEKLEALRDTLTNMIIHDLKSPLAGVSGNLQLLRMQSEDKLLSDFGNLFNFLQNLTHH